MATTIPAAFSTFQVVPGSENVVTIFNGVINTFLQRLAISEWLCHLDNLSNRFGNQYVLNSIMNSRLQALRTAAAL